MNLMVPSFSGIINTGVPYWDFWTGANAPISTTYLIYLQKVSLLILGTV